MNPPLTAQQSAFRDFLIQNPTTSVTLEALAGTGKTFTLLEGLKTISTPTIFLAFNKKIQLELESKVPENVVAKTFNSLGHSVLAKMVGRRLALNTDKMYSLTKTIADDHELKWDEFSPLLELAKRGKAAGIIPKGAWGSIKPQNEDFWEQICDAHDLPGTKIPLAEELIRRSIALAFDEATIDFDDQIVLPVRYRGPFPKYDTVFVDEAQDLNALQHEMVRRITRVRLVAAGDPHQAIYGFRGASRDSMSELSDMFSSTRLPLTKTWRCPKEVVRTARAVVPFYEAAEANPEGKVETLPDFDPEDFPAGAAILCRYNAPLFQLATQMIKRRLSCRIEGRDLGAGLVKTIESIAGESTEDFLHNLEFWYSNEMAKAEGRATKQARIQDRYECAYAVVSNCENKTEALAVCKQLFSRQTAKVTLSSIHKAKGLEWPIVYFLEHNFKWRDEQDENAWYVAVTRAQKELYLI